MFDGCRREYATKEDTKQTIKQAIKHKNTQIITSIDDVLC